MLNALNSLDPVQLLVFFAPLVIAVSGLLYRWVDSLIQRQKNARTRKLLEELLRVGGAFASEAITAYSLAYLDLVKDKSLSREQRLLEALRVAAFTADFSDVFDSPLLDVIIKRLAEVFFSGEPDTAAHANPTPAPAPVG